MFLQKNGIITPALAPGNGIPGQGEKVRVAQRMRMPGVAPGIGSSR